MKIMNFILNIITIFLFLRCFLFPCYSDDLFSLKEEAKKISKKIIKKYGKERIISLIKDLTNENPLIAKKAIIEFTKLGEQEMVSLGLKYPSSIVKIVSAKGLREIGTKKILPSLLQALEKANSEFLKGGSEVIIENRELKKNLIETISKITGLKYESLDVDDNEAISRMIQEVKDMIKDTTKSSTNE